jgi:SulP family sulfate permease
MRFLSEPLMAGFISAVGVVIVVTQLGPLFGYAVPQESLAYRGAYEWARRLDQVDTATLAIDITTIVVLLVARRRPRIPTALALVVAGSLAVLTFGFDDDGIAVVGHVPGGLAGPDVPPLDWLVVRVLLPAAFAITFVGFLESIALTREYAREHHYDVTTDGELVALGMANTSSGLFQGMIMTGAVTRTSIVDAAGARTQLSGVVTALVVAPLLVFAPDLFSDIPVAVLAGIVIAAVVGFVKVGEARRLWRVKRSDFWIMILAFVSTIAFGLEFGVVLTAVASLVLIVYRVTRPGIPELGRRRGTDAFVELARHPPAATFPGTVIIRPEAPLVFTSAESLEHRIDSLAVDRSGGDVHTVVLDASGVNHVDATGDHALRLLMARLQERGVRFLLVNVHDDVCHVLDASGFTQSVGADAYFATDEDAVAHLESEALSPRRAPRTSEGVREAAVGEVAEHELAVDALDHVAGPLRPRPRRRRGDPPHHLRVTALVHPVLGPGARVVLGARHLDARDVARPLIAQHPVGVRVPRQVADEVLAAGEHREQRLEVIALEPVRGIRVLGRMVREHEHRVGRRRRDVVEPRPLLPADLTADAPGHGGVEHREHEPRAPDRRRRVLAGELGIADRVVVAAHVVHPRTETAVAGEERLVLLDLARVGEIALHHDHVGIEREHLVDDRAVHHLGVRGIAGSAPQDGSDGVGGGIPGAAAFGLPEVHVVRGRDRGEQRARRLDQRAHPRRQPPAGLRALHLELVLRVGNEPADTRRVERPLGDHLDVTDAGGDPHPGRGGERDHDLARSHARQLGVGDVHVRSGRAHRATAESQARLRRVIRPDSRHGPRCRPARCERRRAARTHSWSVSSRSSTSGAGAAVDTAIAARIAATSSRVASGEIDRSRGGIRAARSRACATA